VTDRPLVEARIERSSFDPDESARCLVLLEPELLERLGAAVGDVVEITTGTGRRSVGRLGEALPADRGSGTVRFDRLLRQALKARLNDHVTLTLIEGSAARHLVLAAPVDVARAHGIMERIQSQLTRSSTPCATGSRLYLRWGEAAAGAIYDVVEVDPDPGVFSADTEVVIEPPGVRHTEGQFDVTFEDVGGLAGPINLCRELIQLPLQLPQVYRQLGVDAPRGLLLYGPPGCGKTHLARALSNEIGARFFLINGPTVVGTIQGETESNLRAVFNEAAHHSPAVIVIDEIDSIAPHRRDSGSQSEVRIVSTLLTLMDGLQKVDGVMVVGTTNRLEAVDGALRRPGRFDREIFIGPPNTEARREILDIHVRDMPLSDDAAQSLSQVAKVTHGYVGADLVELCREAALTALRRRTIAVTDHLGSFRFNDRESLEVEARDFQDALSLVRPTALREAWVTTPRATWNDIGGHASIKRQVRQLVELPLLDPERYRKAGLRPPSGILIYGPSGTGKSSLVHALANAAGVNLIVVDGPSVYSKWLGESEAAIRHIFSIARQMKPVIVVLEQLESLAPVAGADEGNLTTHRVRAQILSELDAVKEIAGIVTIGLTSSLDQIDPSIYRAGRLALRIPISLPGRQDRREILAVHLKRSDLAPGVDLEETIAWLAERTECLSGADLADLVERARFASMDAAQVDSELGAITREALAEAQEPIRAMVSEGAPTSTTVRTSQ
jgi:transitional endoplasmic reticulum ATPase